MYYVTVEVIETVTEFTVCLFFSKIPLCHVVKTKVGVPDNAVPSKMFCVS